MKIPVHRRSRSAAFTLVEMIGVLSVITILSSTLVPRVFNSIADARINGAAVSCSSVKAAVNEYYGRYAKIGLTNGANLYTTNSGVAYEDWDTLCLLREGYLEKPFQVRIGNGQVGSAAGGTRLRLISISANTASTRVANTATAINAGGYNLGASSGTNDVLGRLLIEAVIEGVDNQDAIDLNRRLDGIRPVVSLGQNDEFGRVKYFVGTNGLASVRVYLGHR